MNINKMYKTNENGNIFKIKSKVIMKKVFSLIFENHKLALYINI